MQDFTHLSQASSAALGASGCLRKQAKMSLGTWAASGDKEAQEP